MRVYIVAKIEDGGIAQIVTTATVTEKEKVADKIVSQLKKTSAYYQQIHDELVDYSNNFINNFSGKVAHFEIIDITEGMWYAPIVIGFAFARITENSLENIVVDLPF